MLAWIDIETTGLDESHHHILEVACVITRDSLEIAAEYTSLVIPVAMVAGTKPHSLRRFNPNHLVPDDGSCKPCSIYGGHFNNGLVEELKTEFATPDWPGRLATMVVDQELQNFIRQHCPEPVPLAGSSVHFDRAFLAKHMPGVIDALHYRNVDVSTVRELAKRWRPRMEMPVKGAKHRALDDIYDSIRLLRFFREEGFIG